MSKIITEEPEQSPKIIEILDQVARAAGGPTRAEAHAANVCVHCKQTISPAMFASWTPAGRSEYRISGMCEPCFDALFADDDEEEEFDAEPVMMACGHVANGTTELDGATVPVCVICWAGPGSTGARVQAEKPSLEGRTARCAYYGGHCKSEAPSSWGLAFFEYRGPGSQRADAYCICGMTLITYEGKPHMCKRSGGAQPHGPHEHDSYYCGCFGWD